MRYTGFWILTLTILLAASVVPARANLITDPGFESCTASGTTPPNWTGSAPVYSSCDTTPHTGSYDDTLSAAGSLSQTIATITGDTYDFSFWLGAGGTPYHFTASFGSNQVFSLFDPGSLGYTMEDLTVTATGTSTTISFGGSGAEGGWYLDDVSVTDQTPSAPEPASLILLTTGLFAIAWRFRRGRRAI